MTDRRDWKALLDEMTHEVDGARLKSQGVGIDHSAGQHQSVVLISVGLFERHIDFYFVALVVMAETLDALFLVRDDMNLRAFFPKGRDGRYQFHLLDAIGREHSDHASVQSAGHIPLLKR